MGTWQAKTTLAKAVVAAGFVYDPAQDIIESRKHPLQYSLGYCWPYDCSSALMSMIIDCERFYFTYRGMHWLIELWKGQYGLETGCEIGVYCDYASATVHQQLGRHAVTAPAAARVDLGAQSRFYQSPKPQDWLMMKSRLHRNGMSLLHRGPEVHWWLTGFKWGVFTQHTHDLSLDIEIDFPNTEMAAAFRESAHGIGYGTQSKGATGVALTFHIPHTTQPGSRGPLQGRMQKDNHALVEGYNLLKRALGISNNDPNAFTGQRFEEAAARVVSRVESRLPRWASAAAKAAERRAAEAIEREAARAAERLHSEMPEEASAAYHKILALYQKKVWRTSHQPQTVA